MKALHLTCVCMLALIFSGCYPPAVDKGFSEKVYFHEEGGSITCIGYLGNFSMFSDEKDVKQDYNPETDTYTLANSWVTVSHTQWDCRLIITAKPSPNSQQRKFEFKVQDDSFNQTITVIQNP